MRTSSYQSKDERFLQIPKKGLAPVLVQSKVINRCMQTQSDYPTKDPMAKPGTENNQAAMDAVTNQMKYQNGNLVDGKMFPGAFKTELDVIAMTSHLLGKSIEDPCAGFMLNGGTESIHQALWMMREKYFLNQYNKKIGDLGLFETIMLEVTGIFIS